MDPMAAAKNITSTVASPAELLRLPRTQRIQMLADAAARAEREYRNNPELTAFDAFREDDLYVEAEESTGAR